MKTVMIALACAGLACVQATVPAPGPSYAPAPRSSVNGVYAYSCPTPGSTGYLFQTAPCAFGQYAGLAVYCDQSTGGNGYVGIRGSSSGNCTKTSDCGTGQFCSAQKANNGTCTPLADTLCFAGALPPNPAPAPSPNTAMAGTTSTAAATNAAAASPVVAAAANAPAPSSAVTSGDGANSANTIGGTTSG